MHAWVLKANSDSMHNNAKYQFTYGDAAINTNDYSSIFLFASFSQARASSLFVNPKLKQTIRAVLNF